ncbi:hypothetical protein Adt_21211 [Abeliophyllum distichum]|uniref:Uncharacterized protein n=1 Tax=Abeliophyllum distichum TaxID=126358 RepID=A0ABD1SYP2_9LAMI
MGPTTLAGPSRGSRFGVVADPSLDTVQFSTVVSSMAPVATISQTQQTVGPNLRHVGPTIDFLHSTGPSNLAAHGTGHNTALILPVSQSLDVSRPVDPAIVPSSHVRPHY